MSASVARSLDQQVDKDLARHHHEKRIGAGIVFEERRCQPFGFCFMLHFIRTATNTLIGVMGDNHTSRAERILDAGHRRNAKWRNANKKASENKHLEGGSWGFKGHASNDGSIQRITCVEYLPPTVEYPL